MGQSIDRHGTEIFVSGTAIASIRDKKGEENRTEDTTEKHGDNVEKQRQKTKQTKDHVHGSTINLLSNDGSITNLILTMTAQNFIETKQEEYYIFPSLYVPTFF